MKFRAGVMAVVLLLPFARAAGGQEVTTRVAEIEQAQAEKAAALRPFEPGKAEMYINRAFDIMLSGGLHWHPYFTSPYSGGGLVLGAGYTTFVSPYNLIDARFSLTPSGYKLFETQFLAPRLFRRTAVLSVLGGWREATQVGFYGFGEAGQNQDNRADYAFQQPFASATLDVRPTRGMLLLRGGVEVTQWKQTAPSEGTVPPVDAVYTPATLPGLGSRPVYLHTQATVALDSRFSPGYARRGGFYGVTFHDFADQDSQFGFEQLDYEAIQHVPILRDSWVLSFHGLVHTSYGKTGQQIPFFMMPAVGGGSELRAFSSWRFRDQNTVLLQAEWRVMASRFLDGAVFYDAGKATTHRADLDLSDLRSDYGFGIRLHGAAVTPLRIDLAKGNEGFAIVFAASHAF